MSSFGKQRPRLADVQCSRMQFQPGDKVMVKVYDRLTKEEHRKTKKMVERWAGDGVEVLIVDTTRMEVTKLEEEQSGIVYPG